MKVSLFSFYRLLVYLRHIHKDMQESNRIAAERLHLEKTRMEMQYPDYRRTLRSLPSVPKIEISRVSVKEQNKRYQERTGYDPESY